MKQTLFENLESAPASYGSIHLNSGEFAAALAELDSTDDIAALRRKTKELKRIIA